MERVMGERCLVKMASYWAFEDGARCLYKTPRPYNQFLGDLIMKSKSLEKENAKESSYFLVT
ncbi:hypothetical protein HanXRQr2_Chr01g0036681 [Helianthus annuus]|uniref:Uncharacterized protein n=1 Tax=Helianthus annuus TaxID=4232 RepID=A0A251VRH9_HELAN|nr:hypothetical protein HanXRQr2_Chr01g0036681 [Helianthus annuus]